jgi:hypothetical protein
MDRLMITFRARRRLSQQIRASTFRRSKVQMNLKPTQSHKPMTAHWQPAIGKNALVVYPLQAFGNIQLETERRCYLVKGLIASTGLAVIWGPPKCGKSFLAMDLGMHIALGWDYRGHKVQQAPVVYIALEGRHGFPARVEAFRRHYGIENAPFYLLPASLDLVAKSGQLIASIKAQLGEDLPGVLFLDTLNRSLVGSESKDEDMARFLAAAEKVASELNCAVVIVHHCGVDATQPRGHIESAWIEIARI